MSLYLNLALSRTLLIYIYSLSSLYFHNVFLLHVFLLGLILAWYLSVGVRGIFHWIHLKFHLKVGVIALETVYLYMQYAAQALGPIIQTSM
jgi:hypothetical protein